jgi:2-hydroxychromene-2-carboxylate isomerase
MTLDTSIRPPSPEPVHFWFDFISPFGYCASLRIDELAARHGREVCWHPLLIGVTVLKVMGLKPILQTPLKGDYVRHELARYVRRHGVQLARSIDQPPMNPLPAARALAWLLRHAPGQAKAFAQCAYRMHWAQGVDLDQAAVLVDCGAQAGISTDVMQRATTDPEAAALLRAEMDAAMARGVFGSPFFSVDGEPFFGVDKLELVDEWLSRGGW